MKILEYQRNKRELLKEECLRYLGGKKCVICGNDWLPACCYDFHHKSGAKTENISKILVRKNKLDEELKAELDKCVVGCSNCHRLISSRFLSKKTIKSLYV